MGTNPHNFTSTEYGLHQILCHCCIHMTDCKLHENDYDGCKTYNYAEDNTEDPFLLKRFE
jgi:hypothetical protein